MTTPKEALERIIQIYERNVGRQNEKLADIPLVARKALASLEGDAVERTIKAALISAGCDSGDGSYIHCSVEKVVRAILATGLVPDEAAIRAGRAANLISIIADIREKTGLGGKPMLNELADAIAAEMDRRVADEREKCAEARAEIVSLRTELGETQLVLEQTEKNAERKLDELRADIATLRARVREVVGPFSRLDISHTDDIDDSALVFENEGGNIVLGHLRAARQLNEDLK